ncbi:MULTISPECIES: metallophosphoesterase [Crateriforma]|uniref:Calcineurin-like phosphoesterase superfamily domain protein n=1 Tax=Crateriforma conspicua TaxID=2527996 RepID=A0A5C6G199_9PLAN|nr:MULTISPECIES: metallophosphoesterase [Crateriforma]TWU67260.1 Calcineurin-like phosphoesterase superfamily domain protein [Crateriforma conspicua]
MISHWTQHPLTQNRPLPARVSFISDLHLFSSRCVADQHAHAIRQAVRWSQVCVWGGDLFDFRWSRVGSTHQTIDAAIEWLDQWCVEFPDHMFVYLRGNHDAHQPFEDRIATWSDSRSNLANGLDAMRIADTLFVHGDVIEKQGTQESFEKYRHKWSRKRPAGNLHNRAYDAAIAFRLHWATAKMVHPIDRTCRRLLHWMRHQHPTDGRGVDRIVFGHTHQRIDGREVGGVRFYNGGAAIRHVGFLPVRIVMDPHPR